jgi:hypothetical protein
MPKAKEATPVHEEGLKLLAFKYIRCAGQPARVKRSVKAKVGDKSPPPPVGTDPA